MKGFFENAVLGFLWIVAAASLGGILPFGLGIVAAALLLGVFSLRRRGMSSRDILGNPPKRKDWIDVLKLAPAVILTSIGLGQLTIIGLSYLFPDFTREQFAGLVNDARSPYFAVLALLIAPVLEEVLFRGMIFPLASFRIGITRALLLTSLLFGILHLNILGAALFSAVAIALYARSSSLYVPIGLHFINNLIAVLMTTAAPTGESITLEDLREGLAASIIFATVGGTYLIFFLKQNWPKRLPEMFQPVTGEAEGPPLKKAS